MTGKQFTDRVFEIGRALGVDADGDAKRGKGSHVTLYYGTCTTIVKDRRKTLGAGLLSAMIRQLGLTTSDFR